VGQVVLVLPNGVATVDIGPDAAMRLAALGVTSVAVLRDGMGTAVAIEGWAFDSEVSGEAAARAVTPDPSGVRVLRPVMETSIPAAKDWGNPCFAKEAPSPSVRQEGRHRGNMTEKGGQTAGLGVPRLPTKK